jgi:hypothetical protein
MVVQQMLRWMGSFVRTEVRLLQALVLPKDLQMVLLLRRRCNRCQYVRRD